MSSGVYGALMVAVAADTAALEKQIARVATQAGDAAGTELGSQIGSSLSKAAGAIGSGVAQVGKVVATGLGVATLAASAFGVESFKTAARVGEMNATLKALAKGNDDVYSKMQATVGAIRAQGIEAAVAQTEVAQFTRLQLDMSKATDLARVAQNAAVISGKNSTDTLNDLIHGIVTANSRVLRNAGINVEAGQAVKQYADSLGVAADSLDSSQRSQAVLNAVLAAGIPISGAYAAAMTEPGKVLRSFPRLINDIQLSVGQGLVNAFGPLILRLYDGTKALSGLLVPGGKLAPILDAIGKAAAQIVQPVTDVVVHLTDWVKNIKPEGIAGIAGAIGKFAPALAALGTGLATFAGGGIINRIPVLGSMLGNLGGPLGAVVAGVGALVATSPDLRAAFMDIVKAAAPLIPLIVDFGKSLAQQLMPVLHDLAPILADISKQIVGALGDVLKALIPLVLDFTKALLPLVPLLADVAKIAIEALVPVLSVLAGLLRDNASWLGPVLVGVLGLVGAFKAFSIIKSVVSGVQSLIAVVRLLGLTMLTPPMGIVVVIGAVIAALVIAYEKIGWFHDAVDAVGRAIATAFGYVIDTAKAVFDWVMNNWPLLLAALGGPLVLGIALFFKFKDQILGFLSDLGHGAMGLLASFGSDLLGFFTSIPGLIVKGLAALPALIGDIFALAIKAAVDILIVAPLEMLALGIRILAALIQGLQAAWSAGVGWVQGIGPAIWSFLSGIPGALFGLGRSIISALIDGMTAAWNATVGWIQGVPGAVWSFLSGLPGVLFGLGKSMIENLINGAKATWGATVGFIQSIPGWIMDALRGLNDMLYNAGKQIIQRLIDGIKDAAGSVGKAIGDVVGSVGKLLPHSPAKEGPLSGRGWTDLARSGTAIVNQFASGIAAGAPSVTAAMVGATTLDFGAMSGTMGSSGAFGAAAAGPAVVIENATFTDEADIETFLRKAAWIVQTQSPRM
jgi:phage-related protein